MSFYQPNPVACWVCSNPVALAAEECPKCGQPRPAYPDGTRTQAQIDWENSPEEVALRQEEAALRRSAEERERRARNRQREADERAHAEEIAKRKVGEEWCKYKRRFRWAAFLQAPMLLVLGLSFQSQTIMAAIPTLFVLGFAAGEYCSAMQRKYGYVVVHEKVYY